MTELFLDIVNMSISAGWLVLAVLVLRLTLKKAPKWVNVLLWGIVAVRLICPISIESQFSLMRVDGAKEVADDILFSYVGPGNFYWDHTEEYQTAVESGIQPSYGGEGRYYVATGENLTTPIGIFADGLAWVWIAGTFVMVIYTAVSYMSLRRKLRTAVILRNNIFQCETVRSPFVLGIFSPRIYLPYDLDSQSLNHVVAHEQAHIRRKDHWWKPLGFLLLTIHWFNPFVWVAYILLCRDIELACDEKVIGELGNEQRADYTQALVACSVDRCHVAACPLAFGEVGVKERVKSIMNYRKPTFWIIVTAIAVCLIVAVCFLTNPPASADFPMSGNHVSDLDPEMIVDRIFDYQDVNNSNVYVNANNFTLTVDSNFNWVDSQTIGYFYWDHQEIRSAQLRIFPDEDEYFLTEPSEWVEQKYRYLLQHYLDALKHLPQEAIRNMAPADRYQIEFIDRGRPSDYERLITYTSEGVSEINGWFIHLRILPLYENGEAYSGAGDEVIDLFYGQDDKSSAGYFKLDETIKYYVTIPCDGVYQIEVIMENSSGGCANADGSCFEKGERIYLEQLDGVEDLRGVGIVAYDRQGVILNVISIPQSEYSRPVNAIAEHGWFLAPDGVDIGMLSVAETGSLESMDMIPTETKLQGLHAGALLLPIDGKTYRYLLSDYEPQGVTVDELLFSFKEPDLNGAIHWDVYSLQESPDYWNVMALSDRGDAWICCYFPPSACTDTALEDAINAGYVVLENGNASHGQKTWKEFYENTQKGKQASVTVAHYHTLDPQHCDAAYYEIFQQDYPFLSLLELSFDGKTYSLSYMDGNVQHIGTYAYLMWYGVPDYAETSSKELAGYYEYILTHDNKVTWKQLHNGLTSSQAGAYIDHFFIYGDNEQ